MAQKTACITGITGQTGSYLAEALLKKDYKVFGMIRRSSSFNTERIDHIFNNPNLKLMYGDIADTSSIIEFITKAKPDFFYNFGAQSHVRVSFDIPEYTMDITGQGVLRILDALKKYSPDTHFVQMSSSEMFGATPPPQNELTYMHPRSPYAVAKLAGYWATINYREAYNMFASNAIMFNHESERRGETFVTRKITRAATRIYLGLQTNLSLGNLDAKRDWSFAGDIANAVYLIGNAESPGDYVAGSGEMHSVKEFADMVFSKLSLNYKDFVVFDERLNRPSEVDALCADPSKIKSKLNWKPKLDFEGLVDRMIKFDLALAEKERLTK